MSCNNNLSFFPSNFILQPEIPFPISDFASSPRIFRTDPVGFLGKRSFNSMTTYSGEEEFTFSEDVVEKKRRLNIEQVKTLEKSFEIDNKLEPERKLELAHALGLKPRQIAIWFQNRRARWKTKQLEKDYDSLHRQIQSLKDENQFLLTQNQKLQAQVMDLKSREVKESLNLNKETEGSCSESSSDEQITVVPAEIDGDLTGGYQPSTFTMGRQYFSTTTTMNEQSGLWSWLDQQHYQ